MKFLYRISSLIEILVNNYLIFRWKMLKSIICWNLPTHIKTIAFRSITYTIPGLDAFEQVCSAFTSPHVLLTKVSCCCWIEYIILLMYIGVINVYISIGCEGMFLVWAPRPDIQWIIQQFDVRPEIQSELAHYYLG